MNTVDFTVEKRTQLGKTSVKKLKEQDLTPGVIYGGQLESIPVTLDARALTKVFTKSELGKNTILNLSVQDGQNAQTYKVITYNIDKNHLKRSINHIDFLVVDESTPVKVRVPLNFTGTAPGIKLGGLLIKKEHRLKIACLPQHIPASIEAKVDSLNIGDSIQAKDIQADDTFKVIQTPDNILCYIERLRAKDAVEDNSAPAAKTEN